MIGKQQVDESFFSAETKKNGDRESNTDILIRKAYLE